MKVKSFAVFCGSKSGLNHAFEEQAIHLGRIMAENNISLVYGGGSKGLMGAVANSVMDNGGKVIGVMPEILLGWEAGHTSITELIVVKDMHIRKKMMYELCDAAIILPGGNGTLDEMFEMLTWNTLNIHDKKIVLLNSNGFYVHLIAHIENMFEQGFLYENWKERLIVCNNPDEIISCLV
ncbi:MAG: TIGR00730 family Rossman fold protein [Bacteroidota bacterium]